MTPPPKNLVRLRFAKLGKVRFISHRDVARILERGLRKAGIPVAYSEGFSPRPRLHFGLALPTAYESIAEYADIELPHDLQLDPHELAERLRGALPTGLTPQAAEAIGPGTPSLQESVTSCTWLVELGGHDDDTAAALVDRTLAADELVITRERKGKERLDDVRPAILGLRVATADDVPADLDWNGASALLVADLAMQPASCRPRELLLAMSDELPEHRVVRTHQWITEDDSRREPIGLAPSSSAHDSLVSCAS